MAERGNRYVPSLATLIRDAQPTYSEIDGEPDIKKRTANERRRDIARDEILRRYKEAETAGRLDTLDRAILDLCEEWRRQNGGVLPRRKGGAPADPHWRMMAFLAAREAVEAGKIDKRGLLASLRALAERSGVEFDSIKGIYYDRDPMWLCEVKVELHRRERAAQAGFPEPPIDLKPTPPFDAERD
jgi:hypothetical protein